MNATRAYREDAVRGATPIGLVVLLYEQAIQDLQRALKAMQKNDIEKRTQAIGHAMRVLGQLQGSLNKQQGGTIAVNLERFYQSVVASLLMAQTQVSPELIRKRIADLLELREAWIEVERQQTEALVSRPATSQVPQPATHPKRWRAE